MPNGGQTPDAGQQPAAPNPIDMMQKLLQQNSEAMTQQATQASENSALIAQALQSLVTAHMTPKKAQKAADGSITLHPLQ